MTFYLVRRIGQAIVVVLFVVVIVFALTRALPGGPARAILGPRATQIQVADFNSMPVFWLGLVLIVVFASNLGWLPSGGPLGGLASYGDQLSKLILPIATLTLVTIALFSRYLRSSMIESIVQDYVRTARAKGASLNRVMLRHVLPNSLFSTITLLGLSIP